MKDILFKSMQNIGIKDHDQFKKEQEIISEQAKLNNKENFENTKILTINDLKKKAADAGMNPNTNPSQF